MFSNDATEWWFAKCGLQSSAGPQDSLRASTWSKCFCNNPVMLFSLFPMLTFALMTQKQWIRALSLKCISCHCFLHHHVQENEELKTWVPSKGLIAPKGKAGPTSSSPAQRHRCQAALQSPSLLGTSSDCGERKNKMRIKIAIKHTVLFTRVVTKERKQSILLRLSCL